VQPGEFIAITGPSGCGKSTLLHLACGLDLPTTGDVVVNSRLTSALTDDQLTLMRRHEIGLVFQSFNLIPTLTALENVVLPTTLDGRSFSENMDRGKRLLDQVGLGQRANHYPDELSGGEAQRVAIARSLIMDPLILLADEPTGNLDSESGLAIMEILLEFGNQMVSSPKGPIKRSTLIVTHDSAVAERAARRIRLKDGKVL